MPIETVLGPNWFRSDTKKLESIMTWKRAALAGFFVLYLMFSTFSVHGQGDYPSRNDPYINDYAKVIKSDDTKQITELLTDLKNAEDIDMVVLTINSIHDYQTGDSTIESFATNLFNTWGIGNSSTNKGVLILVAIQDRTVRIELGSGYGNQYNAAMQNVIDKRIIPSFKESQYSRGILLGVQNTITELSKTIAPEINNQVTSPVVSNNTYTQSVGQSGTNVIGMVLFLVGLTGAGAVFIGLPKYLRYRIRKCSNCGTEMVRLDETSDNAYLNSGQRLEEKLESVDYDVWKCPNCQLHIIKAYSAFTSTYKKCPNCSYRTLKIQNKSIRQPTYTSTGQEKIIRDCRNCKYHKEVSVTLPMLTRPDDNNSFSTNSSNDYSSSDHGGHSSGSGASGHW